jgi:nucleotide-binding universal stress UspA family protein
MQIRKILFHTYFKEFSFNALETLLALKGAGLAEIILVYIIDRDEVCFVPYGGYLKKEEIRIREAATVHFEKWQQILSKHGIGSQIVIEKGLPNATILNIAQKNAVDMIITGQKKRTLFEKVYVGAHILDLLRRSPIPILMHKYEVKYEVDGRTYTRRNDHIFKTPMVATDWSRPSLNALLAMEAFKGVANKIQVSHIIDSKIIKNQGEKEISRLKEESRNRLDNYCSRLNKMTLLSESYLAIGKTFVEIIRLSREYDATMIVLGRTGKDWFKEYWLGGVSHKVAELSELPVMLVP